MLAIPYESQERPAGCGAAALAMVYRSLGLSCGQEELWSRVSRPRNGAPRGFTHLLCRDALGRGLCAVIVRPRDPWRTLTACLAASVRVILHHRIAADDPSGHYSVPVDIDDEGVTLHDPLLGASRRLAREELLRLWSPSGRSSEVVGNVLVAITDESDPGVCPSCEEPLPEKLACAACRFSICLRPAVAVGCLRSGCPGRRWEVCYCPSCDMTLWWLHSQVRPAR